MKPYDEFETFRALAKRPQKPPRYEALDDLHRTLYGTLHPSAERIGAEDAEFEREREPEGEGKSRNWMDEHGPLLAACGLVGIALVYVIAKKKTPLVPLQGPPDAPLPQPQPASP